MNKKVIGAEGCFSVKREGFSLLVVVELLRAHLYSFQDARQIPAMRMTIPATTPMQDRWILSCEIDLRVRSGATTTERERERERERGRGRGRERKGERERGRWRWREREREREREKQRERHCKTQ
jgi:hypothetical protein